MTADEAIRAVQECAYLTGAGAESAALTEDARAAQAAIREAFATDDRARAELARLEERLTYLMSRYDEYTGPTSKGRLAGLIGDVRVEIALLRRITDGKRIIDGEE